MNIGYMVPEFPGQTHNFFWREISALKNNGISVELFSTRLPPSGLQSTDWSEEAKSRTTYLYPLTFLKILKSLVILITVIPGLLKCLNYFSKENNSTVKSRVKILSMIYMGVILGLEMKRKKVTHVHVHSCGNAAYIASFAHLLFGISYSLTLHNPVSTYGQGQHQKWRFASFGIVITKDILADLSMKIGEILPKKIGVAAMGVDVNVFHRKLPYIPYSRIDTLKVFCCARLNPAKGFIELFHAIALLRSQGHDVKLIVAGEDDSGGCGYHKTLINELENLKLIEYVELLGAVSEPRIIQLLEGAHLFVLASHEEPLGVVIMEAMAMGIPVVATSAGGIPDLIQHQVDGFLVAPKSAEAIAAGINHYLENPKFALQVSSTARARSEKDFSYENSAKLISKFLNS